MANGQLITLKYPGTCAGCGGALPAGSIARWAPTVKKVWHTGCAPPVDPDPAEILAAGKAPKVPKAPKANPKVRSKAPGAPPGAFGPQTQKARGIVALQQAGILSPQEARVATTEAEALSAAASLPGPCFMRPCPITPRHGFVESRIVASEADVRAVWAEARAADPQAEAILMPYVDASYNMVWRPGLLSIGPGHDGATAGRESVSVLLQPDYAPAWHTLAQAAGVQPNQDPFVEAVSSPKKNLVVTQIRGGPRGTVTGADWCPSPRVITRVVTIDPATKRDPGKLLEWETACRQLTSGTVVHNPGGNLGDHWSVHAQLAGIPVVTSFVPRVGDGLPVLGVDLVPLDPQAILWGLLGGLIGPSLRVAEAPMREQATVAAILGTHHGLRMGGDAGVFLGASVALMLRLGQAALWGEARHARSHASGLSPDLATFVQTRLGSGKSLGRDQIYQTLLDDWLRGRQDLATIVRIFHAHWSPSFGGAAWAGCAHALLALDAAVRALVRVPSRVHAQKLLAALTNAVNQAHNGGWWLNKFCGVHWFDRAADLDPRAALLAGPVWYASATVPAGPRMDLLAQLETLAPVDVAGAVPPKVSKFAKPKPTTAPEGGKTGSFGSVLVGSLVALPAPPIRCLVKDGADGGILHVQFLLSSAGAYWSGEVTGVDPLIVQDLMGAPTLASLSGSGAVYHELPVGEHGNAILTW